MGNVINLNQFRKQKARQDKAALADANAVKFGRSRERRKAEDAESAKSNRVLDGHKLDPDTPPESKE